MHFITHLHLGLLKACIWHSKGIIAHLTYSTVIVEIHVMRDRITIIIAINSLINWVTSLKPYRVHLSDYNGATSVDHLSCGSSLSTQ